MESLDFESIECEFEKDVGTIKLLKTQVTDRNAAVSDQLARLSEFAEMPLDHIYDFLVSTYTPEKGSGFFRNHAVVRNIFESSPWGYEEIDEQFNEVHAQIRDMESSELREIGTKIEKAVKGIEIVYMPTYRRIENPLLSPRGRRRGRMRRKIGSPQTLAAETTQMNYGLEDVEARLDQLSVEVERISNLEYRSASATIIDEALADAIASASVKAEELPDLNSLTRFLLRVSRADRHSLFASTTRDDDLSAKRRVSAITELYDSGRINDPNQNVLRYFLSRLGSVIDKTKETEAMLQRFVEACNSYLSDSSDEKSFVYEPNSMRVTVLNKFTTTNVPLGQLSSGEKQVISMLAQVYLHNTKNLILIDEPELSLSLDWQRKIIPDMMRSGSVAQLLAITHSPFIFENELDPFAGAMSVNRHKRLSE
ncbi:MAG: AAA family ATPase [Ktedonobacteraceae bacterium]